jgi:hypothetical protein
MIEACQHAKQRLLHVHAVLCALALLRYRAAPPPVTAFGTCINLAVVVFSCEALWLLVFASSTSVDRQTVLPHVFARWWAQYVLTSVVFAMLVVVPARERAGLALALFAALTYSWTVRVLAKEHDAAGVHDQSGRNASPSQQNVRVIQPDAPNV